MPITGVNALEAARAGELTFAEHDRQAPMVSASHASAILVSEQFPQVPGKILLRVKQPREAFARVMVLFQPPPAGPRGIHPSAVVSPDASLGEGVALGECVVVRDRATIGPGTVIESGVHIGADVSIGRDSYLGPNVVVMRGSRLGDRVVIHGGTVIGGDGFGFVWAGQGYAKVPQIGNVVIEDDVEIGCNVCVDRATLGSTIIRRGTKIDNLVQIAHNDVIGRDVIITGQVGFAGSVTVGDRAMFGGQSGVVDHITIGEGAKIGAASPVTKDVKAGETVWGFPARPVRRVKHEMASVALLPKWIQQLKDCLGELERLKGRVAALEGAGDVEDSRRGPRV